MTDTSSATTPPVVNIFRRSAASGKFMKCPTAISSPIADQTPLTLRFAEQHVDANAAFHAGNNRSINKNTVGSDSKSSGIRAARNSAASMLAIAWAGANGESVGVSTHTVATPSASPSTHEDTRKTCNVAHLWKHSQLCEDPSGLDDVTNNGLAISERGEWVVLGSSGCDKKPNFKVFKGITGGSDGTPTFMWTAPDIVWAVDVDILSNGSVVVGAASWHNSNPPASANRDVGTGNAGNASSQVTIFVSSSSSSSSTDVGGGSSSVVQYLASNDVDQPQHLEVLDSAVCANRSSACNVLLDVPSGCQTSKVHPKTRCPVVFCFHGFGGSSNEMCDQCSSLLHENSMIGIYPQGDSAGTRNGHPVRISCFIRSLHLLVTSIDASE